MLPDYLNTSRGSSLSQAPLSADNPVSDEIEALENEVRDDYDN
jgi:hypothetical protein